MPRTVHCRYHCSRCGSHFTSLSAFDAHHAGQGASHQPCAWPDNTVLRERTGACKIAAGPPKRAVTIYEHDSAEAARAAFRSEGD
jgi:hypothetical protein